MIGSLIASGGALVASAHGRSGLWVTIGSAPTTRPPQPTPHTIYTPTPAALELALRAAG